MRGSERNLFAKRGNALFCKRKERFGNFPNRSLIETDTLLGLLRVVLLVQELFVAFEEIQRGDVELLGLLVAIGQTAGDEVLRLALEDELAAAKILLGVTDE